jgi:RNA polymerase sigma-70 factor (ECF subfamily)
VAFAASKLSRDAAEDLAQEVLIVLYEKYAHVERMEELLPLSLQIVRFKILGAQRKIVRHGEHTQVPVDEIQLPDSEVDPYVAAERREMVDRLAAAIAQLAERCRRPLALKLAGKTFPEIQTLLDAASINTVYTWDLRCRKQLRELMGGSWEAKQ